MVQFGKMSEIALRELKPIIYFTGLFFSITLILLFVSLQAYHTLSLRSSGWSTLTSGSSPGCQAESFPHPQLQVL